jgi:homoserine kinase
MANNSNNEWHFSIPCSSANVGPGFDVLGMALDLYMRYVKTRFKKIKLA